MTVPVCYYVIAVDESGIAVHEHTREQLLDKLDGFAEEQELYPILERMPSTKNPEDWPPFRLIIRGHIVTPTPKEVVTEWDVP